MLLVTRPQPQASRLAQALTAQGFRSLVQPLLTLEPLAQVTELPQAHWLIAVSVHAVAQLPRPLPQGLNVAAVGEATAQALETAGAQQVLVAQPPTSEGLLALPQLQDMTGQTVLLAKGQGGRELIQQTLEQRGAQVQPLVVYRRQAIDLPDDCAEQWQQAGVDRLLLTSGSLMEALLAQVPAETLPWLLSLPVLVPSQRLAEQAKAAGFTHTQLMQDASDQAVIAMLRESQNTMTTDDKRQNKGDQGAQLPKQGNQQAEQKTTEPKAADAKGSQAQPAKATEPKAESKAAPPKAEAKKGPPTQTAKPAPPAAKPQSTREQKPGKVLPALALLIALGALAGTAWLYTQIKSGHDGQSRLAAALQDHSHPAPPQLALVDQLQQQQNSLKAALASQQDSINSLRSQWAQRQQDDAQQWPRQEAAMLVRMANRQLYLARDPDTAMALLEDSERALARLPEDSQVLAWRQAIAADTAMLAALPRIDRSGLALQLGGLMSQVDSLPLDMVKLPEVTEAEQDLTLSDDVSDWWDNASKTWQRFADDFLKIRKRQGSVQPLMSPDEVNYLRQNMNLALGEARLAVFAGDSDRYQASLRQLLDWTQTYGDQSSDAVLAFQDELKALLTQPVQVALPAQLDSLRVTEEVSP